MNLGFIFFTNGNTRLIEYIPFISKALRQNIVSVITSRKKKAIVF